MKQSTDKLTFATQILSAVAYTALLAYAVYVGSIFLAALFAALIGIKIQGILYPSSEDIFGEMIGGGQQRITLLYLALGLRLAADLGLCALYFAQPVFSVYFAYESLVTLCVWIYIHKVAVPDANRIQQKE